MSSVQTYAATISLNIPSTVVEPIFSREAEMVVNNTSGFVFKTSTWTALNRLLILGSEKNSYYSDAKKITKDAASNTLKAIQEDGVRVVNEIVTISDEGRAVKNDAAIFALALCLIYGDALTKKAVEANILKVCRIPTHLFDFVSVIKELGKWNSSAKRTIANWYHGKSGLEYQVLKYQQRNGWSHRDVLRLAHVKPKTQDQESLFYWITSNGSFSKPVKDYVRALEFDLPLVVAYVNLRDNPTEENAIEAINQHSFSHEMIPRDLLKSPKIWTALLPSMGLTALIRNLGRLSSLELTKPLSLSLQTIIEKLNNEESLRKSRVHPITILSALKTYQQGKGDKGSLTWTVSQSIVQALEVAFYSSFRYLEPTGKNYLIAIDCSGSMFSYDVCGLSNITAAEASAVFAMAIARTEPNCHFVGFSNDCQPLAINPTMSLNETMAVIRKFPWQNTDFSKVAEYALTNKLNVDVLISFTDNEVNAGTHPTQALNKYRKEMNKPNCKQVICATSVTNFTVSDPKDPKQLDCVGFDAAVPTLINQFVLDQI